MKRLRGVVVWVLLLFAASALRDSAGADADAGRVYGELREATFVLNQPSVASFSPNRTGNCGTRRSSSAAMPFGNSTITVEP